MRKTILLIFLAIFEVISAQQNVDKPNIVIIMADDMGFDDVSFRGSNQFLTPNIDALAYSGVILKNLYTPPMCTPSRSALLTGKYPINTGMQHYVIPNDQPWSLPVNETTMAQIFQQNGYYTSIIGKWHLGFSRKAYTPTLRGFDYHFGYLGAYIDYFDHTLYNPNKNFSRGHDFRENLDISKKYTGTYITDLLTAKAVKIIDDHNINEKPLFLLLNHLAPHAANDDKPLQAPPDEIEKFSYIKDPERRTYAAMMSKLDTSVAHIIEALSKKSILNNTIILFYSDNGGPTVGMHATTASNYPLRGQKNSPWEGALRSSAAIWSPKFEKLGTVWKQRIYVADLLPTLAAAAGIYINESIKLDGVNLWSALKYGYEAVEREIVHNIDDIDNYVSYFKGKWKFINGTTEEGIYDSWLGTRPNHDDEIDNRSKDYENLIRNTTVWHNLYEFNTNNGKASNITELRLDAEVKCQNTSAIEVITCNPLISPCLFDIDEDPCEQNNLYEQFKNSKIVLELLERISYFREHAHEPNNKPADPLCDPKYYEYEWTWWQDVQEGNSAVRSTSISYIIFIILLVNYFSIKFLI
ncbi:arylsulfatase B-like [Teleopsis dalmanni]|uniref:arylsulfatase B-like n=1 Tax=Teleopsis dalmanni TaxID=139649 RepID=UPI0018CDD6E2|nr:arylsulfatase B-like [Teleopsis dalmanni]XP_037939454.1 arylsulfatase B-like [Teleopsis dalmanni]